jgi:hypothetical protein
MLSISALLRSLLFVDVLPLAPAVHTLTLSQAESEAWHSVGVRRVFRCARSSALVPTLPSVRLLSSSAELEDGARGRWHTYDAARELRARLVRPQEACATHRHHTLCAARRSPIGVQADPASTWAQACCYAACSCSRLVRPRTPRRGAHRHPLPRRSHRAQSRALRNWRIYPRAAQRVTRYARGGARVCAGLLHSH